MRKWITPFLVAILAVIPLAIVGLAAMSSSTTMDEVQLNHMRVVLNNVADDLASRTENYVAPVEQAVEIGAELAESGVLDFSDVETAELWLLEMVAATPTLDGLFWGSADGSFLYVTRDNSGAVGGFSTKWINGAERSAGAMITLRDESGNILGGYVDTDDGFDPRTRPWYQLALANNGLRWTNPYLLFTAQERGIAAAQRISGGPSPGVIGGDVRLSALATGMDAVTSDHASSDTIAFVVAGDEIVVHSRPGTLGDAGSRATIPVDKVDNQQTRKAGMTANSGSGWHQLDVSGRAFSSATTLMEDYGWAMIVVAPEDDFTDEFVGLERRSLATLIVLAGAALLLGIPVARLALRDVGSLRTAAQSDSLTHLLNRRTLENRGEKLIDAAVRRRRSVGAIMVDIDHFKRLNDSYGHHAGDEILQAVSGRVSNAVSRSDIVGRVGGDELCIFVDGADLAATRTVANRVHHAVTQTPISTHRGPIYVTVSLGAASTEDEDQPSLRPLMKAADRALYAAKRAGRNRVTTVGQEYQRH